MSIFEIDIKVLIVLFLAIELFGVIISAYFWNKKPKLRRLPILASTFAGFLSVLLNPEISGFIESIKVVALSFVLGLGFYFSVWIQCKD